MGFLKKLFCHHEFEFKRNIYGDEMDDISVDMDYYGGLAEWAQHGREIAGAGKIAREWADEIEAANKYS